MKHGAFLYYALAFMLWCFNVRLMVGTCRAVVKLVKEINRYDP